MKEMCFSSVVREQDREAGLAELPQFRALGVVVGLYGFERERLGIAARGVLGRRTGGHRRRHAVGEQVGDLFPAVVGVVGVELHQQNGVRPLGEDLGDWAELRGVASEVE